MQAEYENKKKIHNENRLSLKTSHDFLPATGRREKHTTHIEWHINGNKSMHCVQYARRTAHCVVNAAARRGDINYEIYKRCQSALCEWCGRPLFNRHCHKFFSSIFKWNVLVGRIDSVASIAVVYIRACCAGNALPLTTPVYTRIDRNGRKSRKMSLSIIHWMKERRQRQRRQWSKIKN